MYNLYKLTEVKSLLERYEFNFLKRFGQNFVISPNICPKMIEKGGITSDSGVIEIGSGIGTLTCEIASKAKKVVSIEIDKKLIPIIQETTSIYNNIKIINCDILKVNLKNLISEEFQNFKDIKICGNLPYYITSPVLMKLLEDDLNIDSATVMVQKEAARRICALPGTRECGALSVAIRYYGDPELLFDVSRGCFMPSPKVDSSVIKIKINKDKSNLVNDKNIFFNVVKSSFSQRRKTIVNALDSYFKNNKSVLQEIFYNLDISCNSRAEDITFLQFVDISNAISKYL